MVNLSLDDFDHMLLSGKGPKIVVEFNNNNVDNSDYFTASVFNDVVRSQVFFLSCMKTYVRLKKKYDELHSFTSELSRAADVIVLSKTWFSANTCRYVQGNTGYHTHRDDKA